MKLTFFGGAGIVTGANYLLESDSGDKILIDCGLIQSGHNSDKDNFAPFAYGLKDIKGVFITHAHIDHTGRLPKLYKEGYRGPVYSTPPTKDFARELLLDSEGILSREAEKEKKEPIYTAKDVDGIISLWKSLEYNAKVEVGSLSVTLVSSGHILGSSSIVVEGDSKTIVFSGDLGNINPPLIKEWTPLQIPATYCLVESAYGDRLHEDLEKREDILEDVIEDAVKSGGTLMIPAFALERIQVLLYHMDELVENGRIPRVPVFVDSPLAIKLTAVYEKYSNYFNSEAHKMIGSGKFFDFPGLKLTMTTEESKAIKDVPAPKVVIAGSGMSQGGRIIFHEREYLPDPKSTILFVGYQAAGSLGRQILEGAKSVRIMGEDVPVKCKVAHISGYSAHADQKRLIDWVRPMKETLKKVFVVQGDPEASRALAVAIEDKLAIFAEVPSAGEEVML